MGRSDNPEYVAKSLSAGQLVMLFLTGAAVCGVFFSAGFWLGHNERESPLTPVTEHVSQPTDIPPVVAQDSPGANDDSGGPAPKDEPMTPGDSQAAPMRPQPLSSSTDQTSEVPARPGSKKTSAAALPQGAAPSDASALAAVPTATSLRDPVSGAGSTFVIQVAATSTQTDAVKMVKALKSLDYPV